MSLSSLISNRRSASRSGSNRFRPSMQSLEAREVMDAAGGAVAPPAPPANDLPPIYQTLGDNLDQGVTSPVTVTSATVVEGNNGARQMIFTIEADSTFFAAYLVRFMTVDGTATAGKDYEAKSGTVVLRPGQSGQVAIDIFGDGTQEVNEAFKLITRVTEVIPNGQTDFNDWKAAPGFQGVVGTGTILNDDYSTVVPTLSVSNPTVVEGNSGIQNMVFKISLSHAYNEDLHVAWSAAGTTATVGEDYVNNLSNWVLIPRGQTEIEATMQILGDYKAESDETIILTARLFIFDETLAALYPNSPAQQWRQVQTVDGYGTIKTDETQIGNLIISLPPNTVNDTSAIDPSTATKSRTTTVTTTITPTTPTTTTGIRTVVRTTTPIITSNPINPTILDAIIANLKF